MHVLKLQATPTQGALHARAAYAWSVETSIYVRESERKSGIGKALYASLEKALAAQNMTNTDTNARSPVLVVEGRISEP
ncbi:MAG: N-acetyltransferase family protein [Ruminococcus sp.]